MSITISYDASSQRLRLEGHTEPGDVARVREAIDAFGSGGSTTIVDLTAVTHLADEIAEVFADACASALREGRAMVVLRRAHSQVDHVLSAAEVARPT